MAEAYALPTSSMGKISRWYNAKKAAGQTVQPWELESAYTGEMNSLMGARTANRGLSLQAARDAENVRMNNVNTALTEARDAEARRMNTVNTGLTEQQIGAGKEASYANLAGTGLTTFGLYELLKKPDVPGAPGVISKGYNVAKEGIGNAYNAAKNYFNPPPTPTEIITAPTTVEPAMLGLEGTPVTTTGAQVGQGLTFDTAALDAAEASAGASMNAMAAGPSAAAMGDAGSLAGVTAESLYGVSPTGLAVPPAAAGTSWLLPAAVTYGLSKIVQNNLDYGGLGGIVRNVADTAANVIDKPVEIVSDILKRFCFVKGTMVEMEDGSKMPVDCLDLGDRVKEGGAVIGTGKILSDNLYEYHGQVVEGDHAAFEDGKWIRVKNSGTANVLVNTETRVVYPIITENHLMVVGGRVYADLCETNQGWNVTDVERLMYLNSQETINKHLMETYEN